MNERAERKIDGCLLQAGIQFPQEDVLVCGHCPNRSDMIGNLGTACKVTLKESSA